MRTSLALVTLLAGLVAAPASAQIKLPKVKSPVSTAATAAGVPGASASKSPKSGQVEFDAQVLEITPANVDRLMKGLEAEQAMAARVDAQDLDAIDRENEAARKAHEGSRKEWEQKHKAWKQCGEGVARETEAAMGPAPTAQDQARLQAVADRVRAAQAAGNMAEVKRLTDSLVAAAAPMARRATEANAAAERGRTKCGDEPQEPESPPMKAPLDYRSVREAGLKASGFTDVQYSILRERVAPFVAEPSNYGNMVYTDDELATMKAKQPELKRFQHILQQY